MEVTTDDGTVIILDCGSGARALGQHLIESALPQTGGLRLHLFIGHTHWDHIQGFPFFVPAFRPDTELNIYAAAGFQRSLEESLAGQMQYSYFPVKLRELRSRLHFTELEEGFFRVGDVLVETQHLNHTAPTIAYRITGDGATVAYTTDHEPFWKPSASDFQHPGDQRHIAFLRGADLVIHDAQYVEPEYPQHLGWGHSTVEYATDVCSAAGAARLALFHHDPARSDAMIETIETGARVRVAERGTALEVFAAAEGMALEIRGTGATPRPGGASALRRYSISGKRVLMIGIDEEQREAITGELSEDNLTLLNAPDASTAIQRVASMAPDLAVLASTGGGDPDRVIRELRSAAQKSSLPVLVIADDNDASVAQVSAEATDYLATPLSAPMVRSRIRAWLARASAESPGAEEAIELASEAAPAQAHPSVDAPPRHGGLSPERVSEMLAGMPVFRSLNIEELAILGHHGTEFVFEPGHTILRQYDASTEVFVILSGRVRVLEESDEHPGGQTVIAELGAGEIFGEMAVLIEKPRSATVVAAEETRCLGLPATELLQVLRRSPDFAVALLRVLAGRIYDTDRRMARYAPDPLTGLPGRRAFYDQYSRLAAHARRRGTGATLVTLDIVDLHLINDRFGYPVGDDVLRAVADALKESARRTDLIARFGGDEFVMLLLDSSSEPVTAIIDRLNSQLDDVLPTRGLPDAIRCSVGVASTMNPPDLPDDLMIQADEDMQRRRASS